VTNRLRQFAASSNGDRWFLGRDEESAAAYVLHQANQPSGGARTRIEIIDFLERGRVAPEHYAFLVMIGTLIFDGMDSADRSSKSHVEGKGLTQLRSGNS
jgi:hypothetical protein